MVLRIDPRLSIVWRSPTELQFGAPTAVAVVPVPSDWDLQVIELFRIGIEPARLERLVSRSRKASARERVAAIITALTPALDHDVHRREQTLPTVQLRGEPALVARLGRALTGLGFEFVDDPQVVILIDHFVAQPPRYQPLLATDQHHVAVICDDSQIRISPVITPGKTACLFCLELCQREADPQWTVVASQLVRRRAASANTTLLNAAAIELSLILESWFVGSCPRDQLTLVCCAGRFSQPLQRHPECGCGSLPGTATVPALPATPARPSSPTADGAPE